MSCRARSRDCLQPSRRLPKAVGEISRHLQEKAPSGAFFRRHRRRHLDGEAATACQLNASVESDQHANIFFYLDNCRRSVTASAPPSLSAMSAAPPSHFLQFKSFSRDELAYLFERTRWIKERFKRYELYQPLRDRTLAMVFEKASTRTRVSFEAGMNQLGGIAINLRSEEH